MNIAALAPVRRAVPLRRGRAAAGQVALAQLLGVPEVSLWASGTVALQAVLQHCQSRSAGAARDEVILPAYACPDLLTACHGAGLAPRLVDVDAQGWGYDLAGLRAALGPRTLAVVAVNLLGVGDDAARLRVAVADASVALIQDWAQCLPQSPQHWAGDFQVFSFGRGKPLNLLGGGAATGVPHIAPPAAEVTLRQSLLAAALFNLATRPWAYGLVSRLPGLALGQTRYHTPTPLRPAPAALARRLAVAVPSWCQHSNYSVAPWLPRLAGWRSLGIEVLQAMDAQPAQGAPLRLALLARDGTHRNRIMADAAARALGLTVFYGRPLPRIADVPADVAAQGPFLHAQHLADRLFTLPTHAGVTPRVVAAVDALLRRAA